MKEYSENIFCCGSTIETFLYFVLGILKLNMLLVKQYGKKGKSPPLLHTKKIGRMDDLFMKNELMSHRYPETGPLSIINHQKYLEFSKDFFVANYGKSHHSKVKMDDFTLSYEIGHGTFGNVILAKHLSSNIDYSIKIISKRKLIRLGSVEQTLQEKNILQGLNNPFTIYLAYFFMDNSYLYFVLPYINGGELFDYLLKFGRFKEQQAQFYISQVILGLEYLHHLDLIYRDLKPENILIDHTGYLKLVDFGFSKILKSSRTYTLCGTPEYMAPEIILNKGHGPPADWWATGVLLYELVAGFTPFHHKDKMRIYEKIVTNDYEMSERFSDLLKDLIGNLLQNDATKRYGNLKGGVNDIKQHRWFRSLNWLAILNRKITPEFIPRPEMDAGSRRKPVMDLEVVSQDKFENIFKEFNQD